MSQYRPTVLTVSLSTIANNFKLAKAVTRGQVRMMTVVKANAYGHGMIPVAERLLKEGADALAVATVDEGIALREAGILAPTLVMGGTCQEGVVEAVNRHLALTVYDEDTLRRMEMAAKRMPSFIQCWRMAGISSVRSRKVKPVKPAVWVERTADGRMQVSMPQADRMGSATVREHWPTQEIS